MKRMTYLVNQAIIGPKVQQWRDSPPPNRKQLANLALSPQWKPVLVIYEDTLPSIETVKKLIKKHVGSGTFFIWKPPKEMVVKRLVVE